jgi:ABC-type proline/glycine betaine transport system permease subunit
MNSEKKDGCQMGLTSSDVEFLQGVRSGVSKLAWAALAAIVALSCLGFLVFAAYGLLLKTGVGP